MGSYDYVVPLLILVCLILCIMVFLWVKQQRDNLQGPVIHKPVYSTPYNPVKVVQIEGFDVPVTPASYSGSVPTAYSGSTNGGAVMASVGGAGSGSGQASAWPSQFDLSPTAQVLYGTWEITDFDSFYDAYEQNENDAAATQLLKFNDITPAPSIPPDFGSSLGAFDSDTTRIPWDKDNESYEQKDVVWGYVSEQASRSIYLKTYVNELAASADSFVACSESDPSNYCYKSPLFDVSVNDPNLAYAAKAGEAAVMAVGMVALSSIAEKAMDMSNYEKVIARRKESIGKALDSFKSKASHELGSVRTFTTKVGSSLGLGVGARKVISAFKGLSDKVAKQFKASIKVTRDAASNVKTIITSTLDAAAAAAGIATAATAGAAAPAAVMLEQIAFLATLFFQVFGGIMMGVEAILEPMMDALLHTGGECPENYNAITDLVPTPLLMILSAIIPIAPFLQMFDPFVCWGKDDNGMGNVRMRMPPKVPSFMSDRTLSLVYHAAWQTEGNPAVPSPTNLSFILDPLPSGYVWLENSDLANNPNVNELTRYAKQAAQLAQGSMLNPVADQSAGGDAKLPLDGVIATTPLGGDAKLPSNIAVKTCEYNTVSSADGKRCVKKEIRTGTTLPNLSPCPARSTDDGYNCWKSVIDPNCTGGQISYTTENTWNDVTGYFKITNTPLVCKDGTTRPSETNIAKNYIERIQCPADFPERLPTETLCFAKCPEGFIRLGALCLGTTESYDRSYMFGTSTIYKEQKFNPNKLIDLNDVTIPYCDFSKPYMLDKMAQFYYANSLQNPVFNEDGTIQIQMITKFFGVIASSELSCDVVCSIDFISYEPITGANYSSYTGCSYPDDDMFKACSFCYRRFYFIRTGDELNPNEFTVTGCTWADYTAPEAMVQSNDVGTNPVASLPKVFTVIRKEASIVDYARFNAAWSSGQIMAQAGAGLLDAGISIAAGMMGSGGGAGAAKAIVGTGVKQGAKAIVKGAVKADGQKIAEKEAAEIAANVAKALNKEGDEGLAEALKVAKASGIDDAAAKGLVSQASKHADKLRLVESRGELVGGIVADVGAGLFSSMYLQPLLANTFAGATPPEDVDGTANTFVTGIDMFNLQVATNNNWWTANQGPIYELATGVIPKINFCEGVKISSSHCTHKYVVRDMVNKYHNENKYRHIKEILAIEPRGANGCYYKLNEVQYDPDLNKEEIVLQEKEVILSHSLADYATCTFKPTTFTTNIDDPAYTVRSYIDPTTLSMAVPRTIFPTRNTVYTSDLFARYVRVRPPLSGVSGDGLLNLAQISVFDVSGFNISVQMPTYATSVAPGAADADTVVNGTSSQTDVLSTVWQPATNGQNEYWEVDLSGLRNISEVIYFGSTFEGGELRNKGVRIEYLYTNGPNDAPIMTSVTTTDEPIQVVTVFSSSYMTPMFPVGGPIKIPRPIVPGKVLGVELGCINRCEDKSIIDTMVTQYNSMSTDSAIVKILRAVTPNSTTCEYDAEVTTTDINAGSSRKNTITRQILSMQVAPTATKGFGNVFGRYIKISPNNVPGTILEFSRILVRNTVRGGSSTTYENNQHYIVSDGKNITAENTFIELKELYSGTTGISAGSNRGSNITKNYSLNGMNFLLAPPEKYNYDYTTIEADMFPNVWRAADNQAGTYFTIDLLPPGAGSPEGGNYEIYDIVIIGASDRTPGGLRGVKVEIFPDLPTDPTNAFTAGVATPSYTYYLPNDDIQQYIRVEPASKCEFTLTQTDLLRTPTYLQDNSFAFTAEDTSGGVFSFTGVLDSVKSAWSSLSGISPTAMVGPIQDNLKNSNKVIHSMLDTVAGGKSILNSGKKCSDPDMLKLMMTAYNVKNAAPLSEQFGITKSTMKRIIKAGQSTTSTCDLLFEDVEETYDDYMEDITDSSSIVKTIRAVRFPFVTVSKANTPVAPDINSMTYDISANALGIMSDSSVVSPVYTGPSCGVDCSNATQISVIANNITNTAKASNTGSTSTEYTTVTQTFQTSPLSCEYKMSKVVTTTSKLTGKTTTSMPLDTYVKAIFTLDTDGCTPLLSTVTEYDPELITFNSSYSVSYLKGVKVTLPNLYEYDPTSLVSTRVDSTVKNIS